MARSTAPPLCPRILLKGGYKVQPVPTPLSHNLLAKIKIIAGGSNQNLKLFRRGKLISCLPSISGRSQFPKPPIETGITKKKIIKMACAENMTLYKWSLPKKLPAVPTSRRIIKDILAPTKPLQKPKIKYSDPISLWFVLANQRVSV
jgi:hypothetical protein